MVIAVRFDFCFGVVNPLNLVLGLLADITPLTEATELEASSDTPQKQPPPDNGSAAQSQATAAVMEQDERIEIASTPASGSDEDDHSMGWFSHYPLKKYSKR